MKAKFKWTGSGQWYIYISLTLLRSVLRSLDVNMVTQRWRIEWWEEVADEAGGGGEGGGGRGEG